MTEDIWKLARDWTLCASRDGIERSANLAAALNLAAIAEELRRSNEDRDRFYREVLEVLTSAKGVEPGPCPSGTPVLNFGAGALPVQSCDLRAGHDGMHESSEGSRWTDDDEGSLRSEQPAAAPGCRVCGNLNIETGEECLFGDITRAEWLTHRQNFFETALSFRTEYGAGLYADQRMRLDFGPCPEES